MKKIITIILILFVAGSVVFLVAKEFVKKEQKTDVKTNTPATEKTEKQLKKDRLNIYYFHTTYRCPSCHKIENYTKNTINTVFKKQLENGSILFQEINTDTPEHKHFIKDFKLHTKSVIVEQIKNDKQIKWENLEKVWELLGNESQFALYIQTEVEKNLKEAGL